MVLPLIEQLFLDFRKAGLRFCVWKSSTFLHQSLRGEGDLDLLIEGGRFAKCRSLLHGLGFIEGVEPKGCRTRGIWHFFGFDEAAGKIVHVHLQDRLLVGEKSLPNYHLSVEDLYLEQARAENGIPLPEPELELINLVIRLTLPHHIFPLVLRSSVSFHRWPSFIRELAGHRPPLSAREKAKLDDLRSRCAEDKLADLLSQRFPWLAPELFRRCTDALVAENPPRHALIRIAWSLAGQLATRRALRPARYYPLLAKRLLLHKGRTLLHRLGFPARLRRAPETGGRLIAFVGVDGSGKSSSIDRARQFLDPFFNTYRLHFGKPAHSFAWYPCHALLKLAGRLGKPGAENALNAIRLYLLARDRHRVFMQARRLALKGFCVLLDRCPLRELHTMDSPRIRRLENQTAFTAMLARKEEGLYRNLRADTLIMLQVDLATAMARRPEDDPAALARRAAEVENAVKSEEQAIVIDGGQPLGAMQTQICTTIWRALANRPVTIEIIGPPGVGKSTMAMYLEQNHENVETAIPLPLLKARGRKVFLRRLPSVLSLLARYRNWQRIRELILAESMIDILGNRRMGQTNPVRNIILHVGPIFYLAKYEKHLGCDLGRDLGPWFENLNRRLGKVLDGVIWLEATDEILDHRIQQRAKWHALQGRPFSEVAAFCMAYRKAFANIIGRTNGNLMLLRENTGMKPVASSAKTIVGSMKSSINLTATARRTPQKAAKLPL